MPTCTIAEPTTPTVAAPATTRVATLPIQLSIWDVAPPSASDTGQVTIPVAILPTALPVVPAIATPPDQLTVHASAPLATAVTTALPEAVPPTLAALMAMPLPVATVAIANPAAALTPSPTTVAAATAATVTSGPPVDVDTLDRTVPAADQPWSRDIWSRVAVRAVLAEMTPDEYLRFFDWTVATEPAQRAELQAKTIKAINPKAVGRITKPALIDAVIRRRREKICVDGYTVDGMSMLTRIENYEDILRQAQRASLAKLTPEHLADLRRSSKEAAESQHRCREDPRSLSEFRVFASLTKGSIENWTDDQVRRWDELEADLTMVDRQRQRIARSTIAAVHVGEARATIVPTQHTQKGHNLWVVQFSDRVATDRFRALDIAAKQMGGHYSSYRGHGAVPGFQFLTPDAAASFVTLTRGESVDIGVMSEERRIERIANAADRMDALAARAIASADATIAKAEESKQNTMRRAQHAAYAIRGGNADKQLATTLGNIAGAIREGACEYLDGIRHLSDVQQLDRVLRSAHWDWCQGESAAGRGNCEEMVRNNGPTPSCVRFARPPSLLLWPDDARSIVNNLANRSGYKQTSVKLAQVIPPAGEERIEIAQDDQLYPRLADAARSLKDRGAGSTLSHLAGSVEDIERLRRMGAVDVHSLRQMLREYIDLRAEAQRADPIRAAERALLGCSIPGFFPTPRTLVRPVIAHAKLEKGMRVLEPSAGKGDLADAARDAGCHVDVVECAHSLREILKMKGYVLIHSDCMALTGGDYDRIVANPPFEHGQDAQHVRHLFDLLKPGGRLTSIMSVGPFLRMDAASTSFRTWFEAAGGERFDNPEGSFAGADAFRSTGVATVTVVLNRPA